MKSEAVADLSLVPASMPVQQGRPKCHQCHGAHTSVQHLPFAEFLQGGNNMKLWNNAVSQRISMDFLQCRWVILTYVDISQRFTKHAGSWNPSCSLNLSDIWVVRPKRGSRQEAVGIRLPSSGLHTETVDMLGLQRISWTRLSMRSSWGNVLSWDTRHIWHVSDE